MCYPTYLRQGSRISITKRSVELAAGINTAYQGAVYTMECAQDGSGVSVKAIYQWAHDANQEWTHYVSEMQLDTDPERRYRGRLVWRLPFKV